MAFDVLIIGGGVIGRSAALHCARGGAKTALVSPAASGASQAAAGMLCPSFEALHFGGPSLERIGNESLALWDGFAASLTEDPVKTLDYVRDGAIGIGFPKGALAGSQAAVPDGIEAGSAVLVDGEGRVDPRRLDAALGDALAASGTERIEGRAEGLLGGARVSGVRLTDGRRLEAALTVVATGAVPFLDGFAPEPVRGRAFLIEDPVGLSRVVRSPSVYFCPRAGGLLYVGATEEERDMPSAPDALWHEASWVMPAIKGARIVDRFDGLRPRMKEGLPMIGRHPGKGGLLLALGHHRNGVLLAPYTARKIAELVLRDSPY